MSDLLPDGSYRGWADLLAARLAAASSLTATGDGTTTGTTTGTATGTATGTGTGVGTGQRPGPGDGPGFRYANLAVRGKLIRQISEDQVDVAAAMGADLVTLVGGLNDVLRPKCDVDEVCAVLESCVERLAPACGQLVLMRSPARRGPVAARFLPRMEQLFAFLDDLAARHGALVVDLYGAEVLGDQRMWADDRLHLTADGHRRVAEAVWQTLGRTAESDWTLGLPPAVRPGWTARRTADVRFTRRHLVPWIGRRLTGRSSGDGRPAKRPDLLPYPAGPSYDD
ncbi:SGNH/GDSL hydrolase family protein [Streptomyces sp. CBMA29]|uniref:SGNH/GDSL hydrolase family protein n=1 Tax=Streptomyces sp. CBMA29 TaxID=1896314 RepID=UPI00397E9361|nr:GDSL family lipase [Streptomyces sp. CBMA29]